MPFDDLLAANAQYAEHFAGADLTAPADKALAVVTCMDSRIDPARVLGLEPGDAKVLRNPGGQVTPEVLVALTLAVHLLGVRRVLVLPHTGCAMASKGQAEVEQVVGAGLELRMIEDAQAALRRDVQLVRDWDRFGTEVEVAGGFYDVATGRVELAV